MSYRCVSCRKRFPDWRGMRDHYRACKKHIAASGGFTPTRDSEGRSADSGFLRFGTITGPRDREFVRRAWL